MTAKFRYGRIYKAYFFEKPIVDPISVCVIAQSFEEALALIREQFPDRTISGFHSDDTYKLVTDYTAVIIAQTLPKKKPPDLKRDLNGVPEECSRSWYRPPKDDELEPTEETSVADGVEEN